MDTVTWRKLVNLVWKTEARHKRLYAKLFYLYKVQKQTKLIYVVRGQDKVFLVEEGEALIVLVMCYFLSQVLATQMHSFYENSSRWNLWFLQFSLYNCKNHKCTIYIYVCCVYVSKKAYFKKTKKSDLYISTWVDPLNITLKEKISQKGRLDTVPAA